MGDPLTAPLLLTDRPWAEIEAERRGPPITPGPGFSAPPLQTFVMPTTISKELWEMLHKSLQRQYQSAPKPEPVLLLTGPAWWEAEQDMLRRPKSVSDGHQEVMSGVDAIRTEHDKKYKKVQAYCKALTDKYPDDLGDVCNQLFETIQSSAEQGNYGLARLSMQKAVDLVKGATPVCNRIIKMIAEIEHLVNKNLKQNIVTGGDIKEKGINQIMIDLKANPHETRARHAELDQLQDKLDDYLSRSSNVSADYKAKGPNGLFTLSRAELGDKKTRKIFKGAIGDARRGGRIGEIGIMIKTGKLRGERKGPNPLVLHTHVGGDAQDNMIVRRADLTVLGFVNGHISGAGEDKLDAARAKTIEDRDVTGQLVEVAVVDGDLVEITP